MALCLLQYLLPSSVIRPIARRYASGGTSAAASPVAMAASVKVAAVQMTSVNDLSANFSVCSQLVKVLFSSTSDFWFLGEHLPDKRIIRQPGGLVND